MSVNKVILLGNVGKDPDVRYLDTGIAVATLPLATTERGYTLKNGTQVPERTEWHNLVVWRGLAEIVEKYVRKGDKLYIEGKIRTRSYDDAQGVKRYITEIQVDQLEMLTPKSDTVSAAAQAPSNPASPQAPAMPEQAVGSEPEEANPLDDLPF